jgi:hypothetical protein
MLTEREQRFLTRLRTRHLPALIAGFVLFVGGSLYMIWAVERLHETPAVQESAALDWPVARMARLFASQQERLDRVEARTPLERSLLGELRVQADANGRLLVLVLRLLLGSVLLGAGLALLASAVAQRRLLRVIAKLRPPGAATRWG